MSESQVELIRRIAKEVVYEILEEERLLEPCELFEFLNAVDAGIAAARQHLKERRNLYVVDKIKWTQAEGSKGLYQKATLEDNKDNVDFKAMVKDLADHGGKMTREGYFCWLFKNGSVIGRKKR